MSDFDPQKAWRDALQDLARENQTLASILPMNKAALIAALAAGGATHVVVIFDGCGDSGQIEEIEARNGDNPIALPTGTVAMVRAVGHDFQTTEVPQEIEEALEYFVYDLLRQSFPGWENNDGAFGEVIFDVAEQSVVLDFNGRYTATENVRQTF